MSDFQLADSTNLDPAEITRFLKLPDPRFFATEYREFMPDKAVFITARAQGNLIGSQALIPYPLVVSGKPLLTGRSERTMADPGFRGGPLFPRMMEMCLSRGAEKGMEFVWGTTTAKKAFQRTGFLHFDRFFEHATACVRPGGLVSDLRKPQDRRMRAAKMAAALPSMVARGARAIGSDRGLAIETVVRDEQDVATLLERLRGDAPMIFMHHDPVFLRWHLDGTNRTIARYYAYAGGSLRAYAYVDISPGPAAFLIDFAGESADLGVLIRAALRDAARRGAVFVHVTYNASNPLLSRARWTLFRAGFVPFYRGGGFVVGPLRFRDMSYLGDLSRWYITQLWFQIYRPQSVH